MNNVKSLTTYEKSVHGRGRNYVVEDGMVGSSSGQCQMNKSFEITSPKQKLDFNPPSMKTSTCETSNDNKTVEYVDENFCNVPQERSELSGKKKTPMCLVNELARRHKVQPQYRLIEESGPAHQKSFVVSLKLGEEEYSASGQSIKKAQHAAAQIALQNTKFQLPEPKVRAKCPSTPHGDKPVTPTVELNALAMKLGCPPLYRPLDPVPLATKMHDPNTCTNNSSYNYSSPPTCFQHQKNNQDGGFLNDDYSPPYNRTSQRFSPNVSSRYYYSRFHTTPMLHRVSLSVGQVFVTGEGPSPQAARHHAAQQALEQLRIETESNRTQVDEAAVISEADTESDVKSPVSVTHELALKMNQTVEFTVLNESGPPHMRNFVVQCKLADVTTQGEGNCKKLAKKKAAELMLEELKKNHPSGFTRPNDSNTVAPQRSNTKQSVARRKSRNLVKDLVPASNGSLGAKPKDPISQLVQLQQSRKEKEPTFTVKSESGVPRKSPEFVVEVSVGSITAIGVGPRKKEAKKAAALKALEVLGVKSPSSPETESATLDGALVLPDATVHSSRQTIPGLLLVGANQGKAADSTLPSNSSSSNGGQSSQTTQPPKSSGGLRPEIRLRYLAQVLEYEVEFFDVPKGEKGDFVSLITLNTTPPQVSHGLGSTLEEAHDNAASNMLKLIAEGALKDRVSTKKENTNEKV